MFYSTSTTPLLWIIWYISIVLPSRYNDLPLISYMATWDHIDGSVFEILLRVHYEFMSKITPKMIHRGCCTLQDWRDVHFLITRQQTPAAFHTFVFVILMLYSSHSFLFIPSFFSFALLFHSPYLSRSLHVPDSISPVSNCIWICLPGSLDTGTAIHAPNSLPPLSLLSPSSPPSWPWPVMFHGLPWRKYQMTWLSTQSLGSCGSGSSGRLHSPYLSSTPTPFLSWSFLLSCAGQGQRQKDRQAGYIPSSTSPQLKNGQRHSVTIYPILTCLMHWDNSPVTLTEAGNQYTVEHCFYKSDWNSFSLVPLYYRRIWLEKTSNG